MIIDNATSSPVVINEYDNVTMECQARGRPAPYITWFRRNKDEKNQNNQTKYENQVLTNNTDGHLYLINVSRRDIGHYECRASNGVNGHVVSKDIELRVLCKIMASWFIILNIILLLSSSFLQARFRINSKRRYSMSTIPFNPPSLPFDDTSDAISNDDSLIESITISSSKTNNQANEQQIEQFKRLLIDRLNLKEPPNVTIQNNDGTGIPSSIVKQLEEQAEEQEYIKHIEEMKIFERQQQLNSDGSQATTERAILPSDIIPNHACQRQISIKLNLNEKNLQNIGCFHFTKSAHTSTSLPTNQIAKQLRIYVKNDYFHLNNQNENRLIPQMFQIYQVFRPASNNTSSNPFTSLTDTLRLPISQIKQLNDGWLELTIDPNSTQISIHQIYKQFIMPLYGLAINRELQSSWSSYYRRYYSKKRFTHFLRSNDDEDNSKESQQQLPYMLVEYDKISTSSSGHRGIRGINRPRPAQPCDPKSPCCRRSLIIDLDQGTNALDFVIYPRQLDIGECVGLCGTGGTSLKITEVKNAQHKNHQNSAYNLVLLHQNGLNHNKTTTTTKNNQINQQSTHCCSFSRTGGLELMYSIANGGPVILPPSIQAQSTPIHSTIGKSIQLRCLATVPFDTKIYWHRMDNKTISKFRQQQYTNGDITQTSLYIKDIEKLDFGLYGCFAESMAGQNHAVIELRENRRLTSAKVIENTEQTTPRMQILKRNKISDQTTISIKINKASTCFSLLYLPFTLIQIIFYYLT
ncbi:unnamed protein product [Rotaria sp. Silwood2]|nr:unnamed protein product [Rotaria sp. Silwood2]